MARPNPYLTEKEPAASTVLLIQEGVLKVEESFSNLFSDLDILNMRLAYFKKVARKGIKVFEPDFKKALSLLVSEIQAIKETL